MDVIMIVEIRLYDDVTALMTSQPRPGRTVKTISASFSSNMQLLIFIFKNAVEYSGNTINIVKYLKNLKNRCCELVPDAEITAFLL